MNASPLSKHRTACGFTANGLLLLFPPCGPLSWPRLLWLGRGSGGAPFCFSVPLFFSPFFRLVSSRLGLVADLG